MACSRYIFDFENRVDDLFETIYPMCPPGQADHPTGRTYIPLLESALAALVPSGNESRQLQQQREYVKIDFQDFIDYATSGLPKQPGLDHFPDQTVVFYESLTPVTDPDPDAVWGDRWKFSVTDAVVARDNIFVSVMMRFAVWLKRADGKTLYSEEFGVTLTFVPESYSLKTRVAGPLAEWERSSWWPPMEGDHEWRLQSSGEYTSHLIEQVEADPNATCSPEELDKIREGKEENHGQWGAFYEVARLGLSLASYVDFMYDLVVTDRKLVGGKSKPITGKPRRGKQISFDRPIYKIVRSIRIIRPDERAAEQPQFRQWAAPSYSFLVQGHWRHFDDSGRKGHDPDGNEVFGRTWIRYYQKYEEQSGQFVGAAPTQDPRVVIKIKQTLQFARDCIDAHSSKTGSIECESPSVEWMADERSKLSAALRYVILKRDGFRCRKCGKCQADDNFVKLEVDHTIPVSRWGRTVEDNLETLCRDCNNGKSNSD